MAWIKNLTKVVLFLGVTVLLISCSISYSFNGSSIDYTKIKTISFENFPNRS